MQPGVPVEVDVEKMSGYVYPPNIVWEDSLSDVSLDQETKKLNLTPNLQGGTVTITYTEELTDETYWAKVEFYNGQNGSFSGNTAPKFVKKSANNTLAQVTEGSCQLLHLTTVLTAGTRLHPTEVIKQDQSWQMTLQLMPPLNCSRILRKQKENGLI